MFSAVTAAVVDVVYEAAVIPAKRLVRARADRDVVKAESIQVCNYIRDENDPETVETTWKQ